MLSDYEVCLTQYQCSLQNFAIGGYILECTEYLHHNLMCFVIQVIILVALVFYNLKSTTKWGTMGVVLDNREAH